MNMPCGRHRGCSLDQLPQSYIEWLASLDDLREPLRTAVAREVEHRTWARRFQHTYDAGRRAREARAEPLCLPSHVDPDIVKELVTADYRQMSLRYHPDHNGNTRIMQDVNTAVQWLRSLLVNRGAA
jgi:hypothetical protein